MGTDALSQLNSSLHRSYGTARNEARSLASAERITSEFWPAGERRRGIARLAFFLKAYFPRVERIDP
jgi:hypothetical protein